jgi:hypothetical protein
MQYVLMLVLGFTTPTGGFNTQKFEVAGFKSESQCQSEIARLRVNNFKQDNGVTIIFSHCLKK